MYLGPYYKAEKYQAPLKYQILIAGVKNLNLSKQDYSKERRLTVRGSVTSATSDTRFYRKNKFTVGGSIVH